MKKLYHPESLSPADRFANLPYIPVNYQFEQQSNL